MDVPCESLVNHNSITGNSRTVHQFSCLYTKQKLQKRKIWKDGRFVLRGNRAELYDAFPLPGIESVTLDRCELRRQDVDFVVLNCQLVVEMENHIVRVEGPWVPHSNRMPGTSTPTISMSMQKVVTRKFRKPPITMPTGSSNQGESFLRKRRRPLQPGELTRLCNVSNSQTTIPVTKNMFDTQLPSQTNRSTVYPSEEVFDGIREKRNQDWTSRTMSPVESLKQTISSFSNGEVTTRILPGDGIHRITRPFALSDENFKPEDTPLPVTALQNRPKSNQQLLLANSFNPQRFYGEDFDDDQNEDLDINDEMNCIETQNFQFDPEPKDSFVIERSPARSTSNGTRDSCLSQEISTITDEQLLQMFGQPPCHSQQVSHLVSSPHIRTKQSTSVEYDDFNLPELSDSSDDG